MGCILSAASCRKWWLEDILQDADYETDEAQIAATKTDVMFLPYLNGERSPHNDVKAKGAFIGLTSSTTRAQLSRAVMEGVAFALRDCLEVAKTNGITIESTTICGGGAKSKTWREIIASVFGVPVYTQQTEHGPSFGAAILAMVGCGAYKTLSQAIRTLVPEGNVINPSKRQVEEYDTKYSTFKQLYPLLKSIYK